MTFKIDKRTSGDGLVVQLIGNLAVEHLAEVKAQVYVAGYHVVMDVGEVTLVSVEGIRFLECLRRRRDRRDQRVAVHIEVDDARTQNLTNTDVISLQLWPSSSQSGSTAGAGLPFATDQDNFQRRP